MDNEGEWGLQAGRGLLRSTLSLPHSAAAAGRLALVPATAQEMSPEVAAGYWHSVKAGQTLDGGAAPLHRTASPLGSVPLKPLRSRRSLFWSTLQRWNWGKDDKKDIWESGEERD